MRGEQGVQGIRGDRGPIDTKGDQGVRGSAVPVGPKRIQGVQGADDRGVRGERGVNGEKGIRGDNSNVLSVLPEHLWERYVVLARTTNVRGVLMLNLSAVKERKWQTYRKRLVMVMFYRLRTQRNIVPMISPVTKWKLSI